MDSYLLYKDVMAQRDGQGMARATSGSGCDAW
jgi:hypothetical protein